MAHTHYRTLAYTVVPGNDLFSVDRLVYFNAVDVRNTAVADLRFYTPAGIALAWMNVSMVLTGSTVTGWARIVLPSQLASALTTDTLCRVYYGGTPDVGSVAPTITLSLTGLSGAWDCETASPADWSGNGNNGTGHGGISTVAGKVGAALSSDGGDDYVGATGATALQRSSSQPWTLSGWWYIKNSTSSTAAVIQVRQTVSGYGYYITYFNGDLLCDYYSAGGARRRLLSGVTRNAWAHIAVSCGGNLASTVVYLDGVAKTTTASGAATDITWTDTRLQIAGLEGSFGLNGYTDDVRVYSRAQSAEEIAYQVAQVNTPGTWGDEVSDGFHLSPWFIRRRRRTAGAR